MNTSDNGEHEGYTNQITIRLSKEHIVLLGVLAGRLSDHQALRVTVTNVIRYAIKCYVDSHFQNPQERQRILKNAE